MTETQRSSAPGTAPAAPWTDMPWMTVGAVVGALEPAARQAARANLELTSLAGERARAYLAVPETLARCRTPFDLVQAQLAFWQEAGRQYAGCAQRLAAAWGTLAPTDDRYGRIDPHETIDFPEAKPDTATDSGRRPGDNRRAA